MILLILSLFFPEQLHFTTLPLSLPFYFSFPRIVHLRFMGNEAPEKRKKISFPRILIILTLTLRLKCIIDKTKNKKKKKILGKGGGGAFNNPINIAFLFPSFSPDKRHNSNRQYI